jgi:hypothetical protein
VLGAAIQGWSQRVPPADLLTRSGVSAQWPSLRDLAQDMLAAAQTPAQRRRALLGQVYAVCLPASPTTARPADTAAALTALRQALGDPTVAGHIESEAFPDYQSLVLNPLVRIRRQHDAGFDSALHSAIVELLARRQLQFKGQVALPAVPGSMADGGHA